MNQYSYVLLAICLPVAFLSTDVTTIGECFNCIQAQSKIVCRNELTDKTSSCCSPTETGRECKGVDFCSNQAKTLSMQMTACPYVSKTCSSLPTNINLKVNQSSSIVLNSTLNKLFNATAICYYTIKADLTGVKANETNTTQIQVSVNKYLGVYVHLNNGTTRLNANDPIQVNPSTTGMNFKYSAFNNTVYMVFVGQAANPFANVTVSVVQTKPVVIVDNSTNSTEDPPLPPPPPIYINTTVTIVNITSVFESKFHHQYASFTLIGCILGGIAIFGGIECCKSKQSGQKDFDILDDFQFTERNNDDIDQSSNRKLFPGADQNYESNATNQDLLPENRQSNLDTGKHVGQGEKLHFFKRPAAHTQRPSMGGSQATGANVDTLVDLKVGHNRKRTGSKNFKIFPIDSLDRVSEGPKEEEKDSSSSFGSFFKFGMSSRSRDRNFSLFGPRKNQVAPLTSFDTSRDPNAEESSRQQLGMQSFQHSTIGTTLPVEGSQQRANQPFM